LNPDPIRTRNTAYFPFFSSLDDLWDLSPENRSSTVTRTFNAAWEPLLRAAHLEQRDAPEASFGAGCDTVKIEPASRVRAPRDSLSIFMPLVRSFGVSFGLGSLLKFFHDILIFASPVLLMKIIQFRYRHFFGGFILIVSCPLLSKYRGFNPDYF
jgi:hypothetical protein